MLYEEHIEGNAPYLGLRDNLAGHITTVVSPTPGFQDSIKPSRSLQELQQPLPRLNVDLVDDSEEVPERLSSAQERL